MQPAVRVLAAAAALLPLAAPAPAPAMDGSVVAVSESGILHLDASGALIAWRPEVSQWWQAWHVATNPRNGTACWVSSPEDQSVAGVMRCAPITSLNETWDLPQPRDFSVSKVDAVAFDWVEENWYLTVSRVNYVCSYMFDRCAKLGKSGGNVRYFAAYDIPHRLLFRIATEQAGPYKLEVVNLDGSDVRVLPTELGYPAGLAVDPVKQEVYVIDQGERSFEYAVYKLDYNGEGKKLVTNLGREGFGVSWRRSMDVVDGNVVIMHGDQKVISSMSTSDTERVDLVTGAVKGATVPALESVEKLLAVKIFSSASQPETENQCADAGCVEFCIPTAANGTAGATCLCPPGEKLVDLSCHKEYPLYAVISGGDKLQVVDMQTNEVKTVLDGLTNVTRVDFLWTGGEEFLLFWVDAGSVFSGRWLIGGAVTDVRTLFEASETVYAVDAAVDWVHRHLLWMERDTTASSSKQFTVVLSSLDGAHQKKISNTYGKRKRAMFVFMSGHQVGYAQDQWGDLEFETIEMTGSTGWSSIGSYGNKWLRSMPDVVAVHHSLSGEAWRARFFWVNADEQSIQQLSKTNIFAKMELSSLLKHPTLSDAGGLDVLDDRVFWTERATGRLWTANSRTGEDARALNATTAGGSLRLLSPWRQPPPDPRFVGCDVATRSGCSHFCVTGLESFERVPVCVCPDGMELADDKKTCQ
ncbi:Low-density lipoprotein receptor-related protein 4 [Amphibalanus amphitrite]|uniref:Low-density lipoprotein receptor-related protein 4 n=1 Tax=Amphibalanus amphitrite TaxID=1232801 RepID=A0A6A4WSU7_AMPAM|nr:Low-density lipoprotein receptor-related protein 4 [Amphibalanus amphitrite]